MQTNPNVPEGAPVPTYTPRPKPVRAAFTTDKRDRVFAALLFAVTLFGIAPAALGGVFAAFGVSYILLFALMSAYLFTKLARPSAFALTCGAAALLSSAVFFLTSSQTIRFLTVCSMFVLSVLWFSSLAGKPTPPGELGLAARVLRSTGQTFVHMPRSVRALFQSGKRSKAVLGFLCALPVFCAVIVLLSRSDAAFEGLTRYVFTDNIGELVARVVLALFLFPFLLSFGFFSKKETEADKSPAAHKGLDTSFIASFLGLLSAAYLVYLFSQLAYFFSAFSGILPAGYTFSYAEYARRGFFELCGIAAINLTLLYLTLLLSRKTDGKLPVPLRVLGTFIDLFTLLLIGTAMAKMILYIRAYGATVLRLGTSAFMLFMAVVFLALLVRFFVSKVRVLPIAAVTAAVILLVLGVGNLHAFCARYNYTQYRNGNLPTIDVTYLRKLGDEGIPYLVRLKDDADEHVSGDACVALYLAFVERYEGDAHTIYTFKDGTNTFFVPEKKKFGGLYSLNLPRMRAYALLDRLEEENFLRDHGEEGEKAREEEFWW